MDHSVSRLLMTSHSPEPSSSQTESSAPSAFEEGGKSFVEIRWFTGLILPSVLILMTQSIFEERPEPSCESDFMTQVVSCIREVTANPSERLDSLELEAVKLTDLQYELVKAGFPLDRIGLNATQKNGLREGCLAKGYRFVFLYRPKTCK